MLFLWDWQLQESFWMPFLVKICVNCKGGCKPEDRGHFYSTLELVSMNNLRVTSVKKQMSNTNWQLYFKPGPVHFQKVSLFSWVSSEILPFHCYISEELQENTFLVSVRAPCPRHLIFTSTLWPRRRWEEPSTTPSAEWPEHRLLLGLPARWKPGCSP